MLLVVLLLIVLALAVGFGLYSAIYLRPTKKAKVQEQVNKEKQEEVKTEEQKEEKKSGSSKEIFKLTLFLTVLGVICALLLAIVNSVTAPRIEALKQKELEETLAVINVKNPTEITNVEFVEGVDAVYTGSVNNAECYVFQTTFKSSYSTMVTTLIVINKADKKVVAVKTVGTGLTTHNMDNALLSSDFSLVGSTDANYKANFTPAAGASASSTCVLQGIEAAYTQLKGLEG